MGNELLHTALMAAVPLWIERARPWPEDVRAERRAVCAQHVASHGDNILFRGAKRGQSAEAFNRLAEGIALLAFVPGGVTFSGLHFEALEKLPSTGEPSLR